jgi:subtilase family serine protease
MRSFRLVVAVVACLCAVVLLTLPGFAETSPYSKCSSQALPRIINRVDDNALISLQGNLHPLAQAQYDQGKVEDSLPLEHIILMLQRSPEQETALETRIDQMHNRRSAYYHQWLSAQDVGGCYGVADSDIAVVSAWLESHGFKIDTVPAGKMLIIFSGTAGQVRNTFHTEIHNLYVRGEQHIANMSEPQIPAALAPVVAGFRSLHNFFPKPLVRGVVPLERDSKTGAWHARAADGNAAENTTQQNGKGGSPLITFPASGGTIWAVGPQDFYTIYNENSLLTASPAINGAGQTLAIVQETDIVEDDLTTFRSQFGLPAYPSTPNATQGGVNFIKGVAGTCDDPGNLTGDAESEADIDVQWMGATAPAATIDFVACASTATTAGIDLSAPYIVNNLASTVSAFSVSFGWCEAELPSSLVGFGANSFYNNLWKQAVAEGQTPVVAAGDSADDTCDRGNGDGPNSGQDLGETGLSVSGLASTPYNVAAGGTDFSDTYQTNFAPTSYWSSNDTSPYLSAKSYIPEMAWNGTCASPILTDYVRYAGPITYTNGPEGLCNDATDFSKPYLFTTLDGGAGGISTVYDIPTWQSVYGVGLTGSFTSKTKRNLPDVSLFASDGFWSHSLVFCQSDVATCDFHTTFNGAGGTSFVAPMLGGIMALINQAWPSGNGQPTRQGQADYTLYALATAEYGTPTGENVSLTTPSVMTCEGSNLNAISTYSSVFSACTFYSINRTQQHGSTACLVTNTGCLVADNDQPCATGSTDCYTNTNGDNYGLLSNSTSSFEAAFNQSAGYNDATGLGSFNISNLVKNWTNVTPQFASTTTANVSQPSLYTTGTTNLTATVTATGRGSLAPPLGTVNFYSGTACTGTAIASANLVPASGCTTSCNATASALNVTGAQIGASTTAVAACFSGDGANDGPSSQTVTGLTVTQTVLTVSTTTTSLSIAGGQSGTATLAVSANTTIPSDVTFTCSSVPAGPTCSFGTLSGGNVTMTINTTASEAKLVHPARGSSWLMLGFMLPGILLLPAGAAAIRRRKNGLWCGLALLLMLGWLGCGGGSSSTPPPPPSGSQTYSVTATAAATGATSGSTGAIQVTVTQ